MNKQHFLILLLIFPISTKAQSLQERKFGTQQYINQIRLSDTAYVKSVADIERYTLDFKQNGSMSEVTIPVVFHVVYAGQTPTISVADITAQVAQLNTDFNTPSNPYTSDSRYSMSGYEKELTYLHPADNYEHFAARAARPMIKFCLPLQDPQGNQTTGIVFVPSSAVGTWGVNNGIKQSELGGSTPWNPQEYCNIWVTDLSDKIAGFAQMPGGQISTDGIVIDQQYFKRADGSTPLIGGEDFAMGRTLVHLMGSYLNLYELWNDYIYCADDYVDDTPIHNAPNYGKNEYRHVTTCEGNAVEMTMNLMDSGCDSTMYMFTWGQVARMQATLSLGGSRHGLTQTPVSCLTPIPQERAEDVITNNASLQVRAIPNPNSGNFVVQVQSSDEKNTEARVQVFNETGLLMSEVKNVIVSGVQLNVSIYGNEWPTGIYRIRVIAGQNVQVTQVVINH